MKGKGKGGERGRRGEEKRGERRGEIRRGEEERHCYSLVIPIPLCGLATFLGLSDQGPFDE